MIVAIMGYGLLVSGLVAVAAWLVERAQIAVGQPRKFAWMGGIAAAFLVPVIVAAIRSPEEVVAPLWVATLHTQIQSAASTMPLLPASPGGEAGGTLNAWLAALWILTSSILLFVYGFSAWRLKQRARGWILSQIDSHAVALAPDLGPAVYGLLRSHVVFPAWLMQAPAGIQRMALAHEREHLASRDPQVSWVVMLLGALLPWNLPLLWMSRRLRFAMEVDCDARVIQRGVDVNEYGLALLYVSERQSRTPVTAIALIERKSQLEQRINFMFATPRKHPALVAGFFLALAGTCVYASSQLEVPVSPKSQPVLKPPPDRDSSGYELGRRFERHLIENYPEFIGGNFEGRPIVVALLNDDWTIARSSKAAKFASDTQSNFHVSSEAFSVLGLSPEEVPYGGIMNIQMAPGKFVSMAYTERPKPGTAFVSKAFPDTRKLDRQLFAQEFPDSISGVAADEDHWVLLDRAGAVLRKGVEHLGSSRELTKVLKQRFGEIKIQEITVTHVTDESGQALRDASGKNLNIWSAWLAPDSSAPRN